MKTKSIIGCSTVTLCHTTWEAIRDLRFAFMSIIPCIFLLSATPLDTLILDANFRFSRWPCHNNKKKWETHTFSHRDGTFLRGPSLSAITVTKSHFVNRSDEPDHPTALFSIFINLFGLGNEDLFHNDRKRPILAYSIRGLQTSSFMLAMSSSSKLYLD